MHLNDITFFKLQFYTFKGQHFFLLCCFILCYAQRIILAKQGGGNRRSDGQDSQAAAAQGEVMQDAQHNAAEVAKLKEMLTQRDNEISIL